MHKDFAELFAAEGENASKVLDSLQDEAIDALDLALSEAPEGSARERYRYAKEHVLPLLLELEDEGERRAAMKDVADALSFDEGELRRVLADPKGVKGVETEDWEKDRQEKPQVPPDEMNELVDAPKVISGRVQDAARSQDVTDHPEPTSRDQASTGGIITELEGTPALTSWNATNPLLQDRVLLAKGIEEGIEPPEELQPGVLLRGKVHAIYGAAATGKTMLMLWLVKQCVERGEPVIFLDMENGPRIVSERLATLGVDTTRIDELMYYLPSPNLTMAPEDTDSYVALLEEVRPALVVFDSWINFLAGAGMDENTSNDIARWSVAYTHPARSRGATVVLLDYVPHDGSHARGSTRKKDEVDVMLSLKNPKPFDRENVGEIVLRCEKDREAYLSKSVCFSVGGGEHGFVFEQSAETNDEPDEDNLTSNQQKALETLGSFGDKEVRYKEWREASGLAGSTFDRARDALLKRGLVRKADNKYFLQHVVEQGMG
jgi:hypothetical protein